MDFKRINLLRIAIYVIFFQGAVTFTQLLNYL